MEVELCFDPVYPKRARRYTNMHLSCLNFFQVSFKYVKTFNMDEYVGIPEDHPESYHRYQGTILRAIIGIRKPELAQVSGNQS